MKRLFTGIEIPSDIARALTMLRGGLSGARWIDPENYHLTLCFIGNIDDTAAREIAGLMGLVRRAGFELEIAGLDAFGGRRPRAVVAGVAPNEPLLELQAGQERLLRRLAVMTEGRKFTPHVTLARLRQTSSRQVAEYLSMHHLFRLQPFHVSRFVLFSSRAAGGGGPYVVEAEYPLAG